jgi:hypothetical protein
LAASAFDLLLILSRIDSPALSGFKSCGTRIFISLKTERALSSLTPRQSESSNWQIHAWQIVVVNVFGCQWDAQDSFANNNQSFVVVANFLSDIIFLNLRSWLVTSQPPDGLGTG